MFAHAHCAGPWRDCVDACAARLGRPGSGLGFVYLTDGLAQHAEDILAGLRERTGVSDWVGTVGTGVLASGMEYQDEPALTAMVADFAPERYSVFSGRAPLRGGKAHAAIAHVDPQAPDIAGLVTDLAGKVASGYLVGGISSSRGATLQIANAVVSGGLSGVALAPEASFVTRLTQGCSPLPGRFRITAAEENVIATLDERPALDVLVEVAGKDLKAGTQVLVGLPVPGSDTGDYMVRNLVGIDPKNKLVAIGALAEPGSEILFCRRDAAAAREDLQRVLADAKAAAPQARGGLYFSCVARGEHMFGRRGAELGLIRDALGEVPLVGFFCNGEISHDRVYGYTGVLALFS